MGRRLALTLLVLIPMMALCLCPSDAASARGRRYSEMLSRPPGSGSAVGNSEHRPEAVANPAPPDPLGVRDTAEFFAWYLKMKESFKRGEFETEEEYQKHLPPPVDRQRVVYFRIERGPNAKRYKYDIATQTLTLTEELRKESLLDGQRTGPYYLKLLNKSSNLGQYIGQNAYGASRTVTVMRIEGYDLNLLNGSEVGDEMSISLSLPPKVAERVSRDYEVVVGVTLMGYDQSSTSTFTSGPTVSAALDLSIDTFRIDAVLRQAIVRDRQTHEVLKTVSIEPVAEEGSAAVQETIPKESRPE